MLFKKTNHPAIQGIILTSLLTLLSSCGNSAALESLVAADAGLKEVSNQTNIKPSPETDSSPTSQPEAKRKNRQQNNDRASATQKNTRNSATQQPQADAEISQLVLNFPDTFPVYPQAELQKAQSNKAKNSGTLIWKTTDNRKAVADYYQAELVANGWDIIKPFTIDPQQKIARAIAVKDQLRVELSLSSFPNATKTNRQDTKLSIVYSSLGQDIPQSSISQETKPSQTTQSSEPKSNTANVPNTTKPGDFDDLEQVPEQLQQPIKSVAALGILTPYTAQANVELAKFAPNKIITRGEYARWLIAANNRYYADNPGKKIYVATQTNQSAFNDVKPEHPDFEAIQSLAEAGLIPSRLTDDSTNLLFRPDAPLTREDLITWKVPLDMRKVLPKASIEAVEESWGFQDATDIDSSAIRALYADFQNGDLSNIRRIFGYTTLFQPNKPVTRAEAAVSLWYFGYQGDGVTAKEVLESEGKTES